MDPEKRNERLPPRPFTPAELEAICKALAETHAGLTGTEIGHFLSQSGVPDADATMTKWRRLYNALAAPQNASQSGDRVLAFIRLALDPARYSGNRTILEYRRAAVNVPLAFYGLQFGEDGRFHTCAPSQTLGEAERRAHRLRAELERRGVEEDVLVFCRAELLESNYFHAVLEATKSVAVLIRSRSGLTSDGGELAQQAFGGSNPVLKINALTNDTERNEQRGFTNLLVGFFGTFRGPTAHAPRIGWVIEERDALDLLSLASLLVRRVKQAQLRATAS